LKQQLDAANTFEDVVEELSHKNQILSERIAEQDMIVQDLENLRELNDELEIQHLDQEQDMLAELEERNNELTEQAQRIVEQTAIITDNEFLIAKFRDLVMDLQNRMASAESSKSMTEAQVKDTTGRFNEVMDLNRQLRAATVQSTTREIEAGLITLRARQCDEKLDIWNETESKEFTRSESLQAYFLADRIVGKSDLLIEVLRATARQMSNGGRFDDAISRLVCSEAIRHLETLRDGSHRLWSAIRGLPLSGFATIGSTYQDLVTVEQALDQGLNALKTDTVNFEDLAGSLQRSTKTHEAVLMSHQEALAGRPEDELLSRIDSIKARLTYISSVYDLATFSLQKVPHSILEECEDTLEHFRSPLEATNGALSVATKLQRTLHDLHADSMYPRLPEGLDEVAQHDDRLAEAADGITDFARKLIDEVAKCSNLSDPDLISTHDIDSAKACIDHLDNSQRSTFLSSNITGLTTSLRHWADHSAVLSNNVEIEHGPTPWAQKANEVEAARKKDDEAGRQLQMLTVEHRTTVLKIHEREQVIATKELEIEHLKAKIRDATTKTEGVEALQEELAQHKEDIAELEDLNQSLKLELEAQRERAANAVQFDTKEAEPVTPNTTAAAEPAQQSSDSRSAPAGLRTFLDALQNENNWMRQRHCKDSFDRNLRDVFTKMDLARHSADYQDSMARLDAIELACLTDDDSEGLDTPPRASSPTLEESAPTYHIPNMEHPTRAKMSALELTGVSLGWEERARSHKVAFEAAEEDVMGLFLMAEEEEDSLMAWP
jgi:dynactin 1